MIDTLVDRTLTGCFQAQHQLGTLFRNVDWFDVLMHVCCHVGASSPIWAKFLLSGNGWHTPLEWVTGTLTDLKIVHPPPPSAGPGEFRGAIFEWHPLPSSGRRFVVVFCCILRHYRFLRTTLQTFYSTDCKDMQLHNLQDIHLCSRDPRWILTASC